MEPVAEPPKARLAALRDRSPRPDPSVLRARDKYGDGGPQKPDLLQIIGKRSRSDAMAVLSKSSPFTTSSAVRGHQRISDTYSPSPPPPPPVFMNKEKHDILEAHFQHEHKPTSSTKKGFAETLGVSIDDINDWFQMRRAKVKQDLKKQAVQFNMSGGIYDGYDSDDSLPEPEKHGKKTKTSSLRQSEIRKSIKLAKEWRVSPSLLDPASFSFNSSVDQPSGHYTPTAGGAGTFYNIMGAQVPLPESTITWKTVKIKGINGTPDQEWGWTGTAKLEREARAAETTEPEPKAASAFSASHPRQKAGKSMKAATQVRTARNPSPLSASPPVNASDFEDSHPVDRALSEAETFSLDNESIGIRKKKKKKPTVMDPEKKKPTVRDPDGYLVTLGYSDSNESNDNQSSSSALRPPFTPDDDISWANWDDLVTEYRGLLLPDSKPRGLFNKYTISQDMTTGELARHKCRLLAVDSSTPATRRNRKVFARSMGKESNDFHII